MNSNLNYSPEALNLGQHWRFFASCDLEISHMTFKNNRASPLCLCKHYASFRSHQWIYIWVTVRKRSNRVEFDDFLPPVTLKFYRRPWKPIGHLFYTHSSFTHRFIDIGGFRFELQSGVKRYFDPHDILTQGSKYRNDILTPLTIFWPPYNNQWQSFIFLLYLLDKVCHCINIILMNF